MKVTMFWHGGSSYAAPDTHSARDAEVFDSIAAARRSFAARADHDPYYPCVNDDDPQDGGPEATLYFGKPADHPIIGQDYPDRIVRFGPRGGVIVERA
jgi:hypothetical protein